MKIIDISAGRRAIWFDKEHPDTTFVDIRPEVSPTVVADARCLPADIGNDFSLVVFDPPHCAFSATSDMGQRYGSYTISEIRDIVSGCAKEAYRVTREDALMSLKWNDHDISFDEALELLLPYWEPLFGAKTTMRTKHASMTQWVMLKRKSEEILLAEVAEAEEKAKHLQAQCQQVVEYISKLLRR